MTNGVRDLFAAVNKEDEVETVFIVAPIIVGAGEFRLRSVESSN